MDSNRRGTGIQTGVQRDVIVRIQRDRSNGSDRGRVEDNVFSGDGQQSTDPIVAGAVESCHTGDCRLNDVPGGVDGVRERDVSDGNNLHLLKFFCGANRPNDRNICSASRQCQPAVGSC